MTSTLHPEAALVARAARRAGPDDVARLEREHWQGWVEHQLQLPPQDDAAVKALLDKATLKIEYEAGDGYAALKEERALSLLRKPINHYWHLADWQKKIAYAERIRPADEVLAATHVRATVAEAQLRESVVDFWRDHFSVNREAVEDVAIGLPTYDQDVLRVHALGNFREMLEAVATSTSMLAYLNNASSKASPANENYARELLELHGLGAQAYVHGLYDRWREVPGVLEGKPAGFIDQDVYESARAFTGWTYGGGQYISEGVELPRTGTFTYTEQWHDPYQKRVLGIEFDSHAGPMVDGRKVLDLVAYHEATAQHVCRRLCQRFVSDAPSQDLVTSAAQVFADYRQSKDQLARVISHILLSPEFASASPRLQRPLFLFASLQQSAGVILEPHVDHMWMLDSMGHRLYSWHTPAGHPLASAYWQSPGLLVRRWRAINDIWVRIMAKTTHREWPNIKEFSAEWAAKLGLDADHAAIAVTLLQKSHGVDDLALRFSEDQKWANAQALAALAASPAYQSV